MKIFFQNQLFVFLLIISFYNHIMLKNIRFNLNKTEKTIFILFFWEVLLSILCILKLTQQTNISEYFCYGYAMRFEILNKLKK